MIFVTSLACAKGPDESALKTDHHDIKSSNKDLIPDEHFTATLLDGTTFDSLNYRGQKILLAFFTIKHRDAAHMLKALMKLAPFQGEYNFKIVPVSLDSGKKDAVKKFLDENQITLPTILEGSDLDVATRFNIENEVTVLGLSQEHKPAFGFKKYPFADMPDGEENFIDYLKEGLKIKAYHGATPRFGIFPKAPNFSAKTQKGKNIALADYQGKPVLVLFFSPKCPHCQHEMKWLRDKIYPEYKKHGFEIIALSVLALEGEVLKLYESFKFDWPLIDDSNGKIRKTYSNEKGVPENFLVGPDGLVKLSTSGFSEKQEGLYELHLKKMLGLPNPPILPKNEFAGVENCRVCHEAQYVSWSVTKHAHAWQTLEIKGEDTNPECVACHSLGFKDAAGYQPKVNKKTGKEMAVAPPWLQNVQCESCHGLGGPHVQTENVMAKETLEKTCRTCHTDKFSLHFDFDERVAKVGHANAAEIMKLSETARMDLIKKVAKKPEELFGSETAYVGSGACIECHKDIHDKWQTTPHGSALATLAKTGHDKDANCLACHTTGFGDATGYLAHVGDKNFEDVGCESCHGPGEKHVATKLKTDIRGLGDDCPFCVIEQICYSCHDMKNSPGFNIHTGLDAVKKAHGYK